MFLSVTFLPISSIAVVEDCHFSSFKPINSGNILGSVKSSTFFLLFIDDFLNCTSSTINSYANDSSLHNFNRFVGHSPQQLPGESHDEAVARLISDLSHFQLW